MNNKLLMANVKLLDEKKTLMNDIEILERRINNAKKYCEKNNLQDLIKILDGEEIGQKNIYMLYLWNAN